MSSTEVDVFDHAVHTARVWLDDIARQLGTDERHTAHRMLRAWLHVLRDRLPVSAAADFAAQLPEIFRGVFYDGWQPHQVPVKYGPAEYRERFARLAQIPIAEVDTTATAVTRALRNRLSPGQVDQVTRLLTAPVRRILQAPPELAADPTSDQPPGPDDGTTVESRLAVLEQQAATLAEAVRLLAHGLEQTPAERPDAGRAGQAARRANELLLATPSTWD